MLACAVQLLASVGAVVEVPYRTVPYRSCCNVVRVVKEGEGGNSEPDGDKCEAKTQKL